MRKCAKCGARNDEQAIVCSLCNERLGVAHQATSYEPRLWEKGRQTFRGKAPSDPNATRDEPRPDSALPLGKPLSGHHDAAHAAEIVEEDRKKGDVNTTRHFLVPQLGEPMLLDATKAALSFGRDEGLDFRLASTKVSRHHADLLFSKADKAYVRDAGSQNGTFVNDEKVSGERALEDGDTLRMGDFSVTYRKLGPGEDAAKLTLKANETAVMETVKVEAGDDGALIGDVSILPIAEVLRRLASIRAFGALNIDVAGTRGFILLADGKPTNGSYAGLEGPPAVTAMASLTKGHFSFVPDPNAPKPTTPSGRVAAAPPPAQAPANTVTPRQPPAARPAPGPAPARPAGAQPAPAAPPRRPSPPPPG